MQKISLKFNVILDMNEQPNVMIRRLNKVNGYNFVMLTVYMHYDLKISIMFRLFFLWRELFIG